MRVLIAEDDPISRRLLERTLSKWNYEVVVTCDGDEAWKLLRRADSPKLAILDWMMPGTSGVDVCRKLRRLTGREYVYIILLTAKGNRDDLVEGMDAGADDYIVKPFDARELHVRVRAAQRIIDLQAELIAAREALRVQATRDALTGLWNRAAIFDILRRELARARRKETYVAVLMADVDHFKKVNDTYGHQAGDAVLRDVAGRMESVVRDYDAVGRYGGEEFLIVSSECDLTHGVELAERVRERIASKPFATPAGQLNATISLGVAAVRGPEHLDGDALVRAADEALYQAKQAGRNRTILAQTGPVASPG